jgi:hypothetical protein
MAVLSSSSPNIVDLTKEKDPSGKLGRTANVLTQTNDMARMLPFVRANNDTHHRTQVVVELPTATERGINEGTVPTWGRVDQVDYKMSKIDMWSKVDPDLAGDQLAEFRAREIRRKWEAVTQRWQYLSFYGNHASNQKQFTGLFNMAPYSVLGQQVIDCGGTTASVQASMALIAGGEDKVYYIYPKSSQSFGIHHKDHAHQVAQNQGGVTDALMDAVFDQVKLDVGIVVEDQRCVVRLANIEVSHFTALTSTQATTSMTSLIHKMIIAIGRLPRDSMGDRFFICNRTVYTGLFRLAMEKSVAGLGVYDAMDQFGRVSGTLFFNGYPIFISDQLVSTEAVVA